MGVVGMPHEFSGLRAEEVTIAEVLSEAGYATAFYGKGHLGDIEESYPHNQGFDYAAFPLHQQVQLSLMTREAAVANNLLGYHDSTQSNEFALDQRFYTDPEIYDLEVDRIINRNWILAGHQSELPEPGDFKVFRVAKESAIIVRGSDGTLKAFANVCRHRGSLVCLEERGNTRKFTCPYHGWMYDIDGNLTAVERANKELVSA